MDKGLSVLAHTDPVLWEAIESELRRQQDHIELIASENYVSRSVLEAQGSVLTNKYAEGYPGKRNYGGCEHVDIAEQLAIDRAKSLFGAEYANVQPHSGSQANQAVYLSVMKPSDTILGMSLAHGGHLTDGASVNISGKLFRGLKKLFKTDAGEVFIFPSSGTGAWEASLSNTLSPGDKVLAPRFGQFSHLWIDMAQRLGLDVQVLDVEWGEGAPVAEIERVLRADAAHTIKGVMIVHNETATGVASDVAGVRRAMDVAGHPAMLYVDTVSSLGSLDFRFDEWRVDLAITGSQKGLMLPAGLGIVCASPRALLAGRDANLRRVFFDFGDMQKANATGYFPYTPALPLLYGLRESLTMLFEEGLDNVFARHERLASGTRAAVGAWGLFLCAKKPQWHSNTVSAIVVPVGFDAAKVIETAYRRYNLSLGAGLSKVAGKVFRIGHIGDLNELMLLGAIAGAEMAMADVGIPVRLGGGVAAAQDCWKLPVKNAAIELPSSTVLRAVAVA